MMKVDVSFITPLYNCLAYTKEYLDSLARTVPDLSHEVILIDDFSTDGTRDFLKSLVHSRYRVILNESNFGFAKSSNIGASHASGKYLCFLNNDLVLSPGWFEPMFELITSQVDIGAVGNIQVEPETGLIHHAGVFFDWNGSPLHAWRYRKRRPKGEFGEWNAVTAACLLIKADVFRKVGGFDEEYKNGFEDIDLCVRLRAKGYRLLVSNRSVIEHHGSVAPGRKKYDEANRERFLKRWRAVTMVWGSEEWPAHYFHRYARAWWKMTPWRAAQGLYLLACRHLVGRS